MYFRLKTYGHLKHGVGHVCAIYLLKSMLCSLILFWFGLPTLYLIAGKYITAQESPDPANVNLN